MATIPLAKPRVITPQVDIETLASHIGGRVRTVQDLLSVHPQIADKVLRYRTGEPLNQRSVEAAIGEAERYMNGMHAQNYLSRRRFFGMFAPFLQVEDALSETEAKQAASLIAEQNYGTSPSTRRDFMGRVALLLTALAAGVSQTACNAAMLDGVKLTNISEKLPANQDITINSLDALLDQYVKYVNTATKAGHWDSVYGPYISQDHYDHVRQAKQYPHLDLNPGGIDSDVPTGTPVVAMHPMYCLREGEGIRGPIGGIVVTGLKTGSHIGGYVHLSKTFIRSGQTGKRSTIFALSGSTGTKNPHLHWEIYNRNRYNQLNLFKHGENQGKPKILTDKGIDKPFGNYELGIVIQPFPNPEFVKKDLSLSLQERFYTLPSF